MSRCIGKYHTYMFPKDAVDPHINQLESRIVRRLEFANVYMIRRNRNDLFMCEIHGRGTLVDDLTRMHTGRFSISEI